MTEHGAAPPAITDLLWPVINFAIFAYLLVYFLRAPVREFFHARTERLREALAAGARARSEAEALRATIARDVADLPALRQRLRAELKAVAERERDTILEAARHAADRIRNDARLLAEHEVAIARETLRAEVIEEMVRQATVIIGEVMRPEDQDRFVHEFVAGAAATP